jgi:hypothetical protein
MPDAERQKGKSERKHESMKIQEIKPTLTLSPPSLSTLLAFSIFLIPIAAFEKITSCLKGVLERGRSAPVG